MENEKYNFIVELNEDKALKREILNAKSLYESYKIVKIRFPHVFKSYVEYKEFMDELHDLRLKYDNQLSDEELEFVSGGVQNKFLTLCLSGLSIISSLGPITTNVRAWDSGTYAVHRDNPDVYTAGKVPQKQLIGRGTSWLAKQTGSSHQPVHESITDLSWRIANGFDESKKIPGALELGSVWNDLMSTSVANFGLNYTFKHSLPGTENMYEDGYDGLSDEIDHLLVTQMNCCSEEIGWKKISSLRTLLLPNFITSKMMGSINARFSHNGRGNYLHCMNCTEGANGREKIAGQEKTYKLVVSWLEAALAYATYGMDINNMPSDLRKKVDPRVKKLIMGMGDIVRFSYDKMKNKHKFGESEILYENALKDGIVAFLLKTKNLSKGLPKADKRYLSCCILEGEYYASQSEEREKIIADAEIEAKVEAEKEAAAIIGEIKRYCENKSGTSTVNEGEKDDDNDWNLDHNDEYYRYRALGMACHTIEDSFNPAHCDRVVIYNEDNTARLGGIKSFLDYDNGNQTVEGHGNFDKITDAEVKLLKEMSENGEKKDFYEKNKDKLKTLGLTNSIEAVKEFLENMRDIMQGHSLDALKNQMVKIVSKVICFDEKIASLDGEYIPYERIPGLKLNGSVDSYIEYVTPAGGRLPGEVGKLICEDAIECLKKHLNDRKYKRLQGEIKAAEDRLTKGDIKGTGENLDDPTFYVLSRKFISEADALKLCIENEKKFVLQQNYAEAKQYAQGGYYHASQLQEYLKEEGFSKKLKQILPQSEKTSFDTLKRSIDLLCKDYQVSDITEDNVSRSEILTVTDFNPQAADFQGSFNGAIKNESGDIEINPLDFYTLDEEKLRKEKLYNQYMDTLKDRYIFEQALCGKPEDENSKNTLKYLTVREDLARCLYQGDLNLYDEYLNAYKNGLDCSELNKRAHERALEEFSAQPLGVGSDYGTREYRDLFKLSAFSTVAEPKERIRLLECQKNRVEVCCNKAKVDADKTSFETLRKIAEFLLNYTTNVMKENNSDYSDFLIQNNFEQKLEQGGQLIDDYLKEKLEGIIKKQWENLTDNKEEELRKKIYLENGSDEILAFLESNLSFLKMDEQPILEKTFLNESKSLTEETNDLVKKVKTVIFASMVSAAMNGDESRKNVCKIRYELVSQLANQLKEEKEKVGDSEVAQIVEFQNQDFRRMICTGVKYDKGKPIFDESESLGKIKWLSMCISGIGVNNSAAIKMGENYVTSF